MEFQANMKTGFLSRSLERPVCDKQLTICVIMFGFHFHFVLIPEKAMLSSQPVRLASYLCVCVFVLVQREFGTNMFQRFVVKIVRYRYSEYIKLFQFIAHTLTLEGLVDMYTINCPSSVRTWLVPSKNADFVQVLVGRGIMLLPSVICELHGHLYESKTQLVFRAIVSLLCLILLYSYFFFQGFTISQHRQRYQHYCLCPGPLILMY